MGSFLKILGGFLLGLIVGAGLTLAGSVLAAEIFNISQMEGAYAMGVVFLWMPAGGLVGGIIGAVWTIMRISRRKSAAQ